MAYPTYSYPSYQSYYPQPIPGQFGQFRQEQTQQPIIQPAQAPQNISTPIQTSNPMMANYPSNGIIWVPNINAANDYLVAANSAVALWDSSAPFVYLKQADSTGKPTIKVFELVERDPNQRQTKQEIQLPDLSNFITRDELEDILSERLKKPSVTTKTKEEK